MSEAQAKPTPGANAIAGVVKDCALELYPQLRDAVGTASKAVIALRQADDFLAVLRCANDLSMAAEAVGEAAEALHKQADAGLLVGLLDSGAPALRCGAHTLGTRQNPDRVEIIDSRSVPESFLVARDPAPDLAAIRQHLKTHPDTNWARLEPGSVSLTRKAAK